MLIDTVTLSPSRLARGNVGAVLRKLTQNYLGVVFVGLDHDFALAKRGANLLGIEEFFNGSGKFHGEIKN